MTRNNGNTRQNASIIISFLFFVLMLASCTQVDLYQRTANIKNTSWSSAQVPSFSFDVKDSLAPYNVYVVIRHTNQYGYRNIWLNVGLQQPGDTMRYQAFELPLATAENWLGTGMDDVYEHRALLFKKPVRFSHTGKIVFTLEQTMRQDPLPGIIQAGIRVEPAQ